MPALSPISNLLSPAINFCKAHPVEVPAAAIGVLGIALLIMGIWQLNQPFLSISTLGAWGIVGVGSLNVLLSISVLAAFRVHAYQLRRGDALFVN
jgi:hypothetical protein